MNHFMRYCLIFMFSLQGFSQNGFIEKTIQILQDSELSITGDTNISEFGCDFNTFYIEEGVEIAYNKDGNNILFKNAILTLKNEGFDCGNKAINKDLHALLNTKEYPKITLELTEITFYKEDKGRSCVKINIAGQEKEYSVPIDVVVAPTHRFIGKLKLDIRDFGLEPPKKFFGLIAIKEEIDINFDLVAEL